jgi:hypothetical protein
MSMRPEEFIKRFPERVAPVPCEYAGQWISWNEDRTEIISHGTDFRTVCQQAIALGCARPILQKIPRGPFVGGA